jgi:nucleoside-diphosphate-sugar epimerase
VRIFVTGGGGYIGTTLVPYLIKNGHDVTVLDRFFFGQGMLDGFSSQGTLKTIRDDVRWFDGKLLEGMDAVVDMAALSNDPAAELDPWKTYEINYLGRSRVARLAKQAGVKRYLLTSSCSIYGFQDGMLTEESKPNPLTAYARANMLAERDNLILGDENFTATAVRFATVYGLSKRMRFDLAVNGMVLGALKTGKIPVMRDGMQWRPFVYVLDAARAVLQILESDPRVVNGQIFNIGSDSQNYMIKELAELVAGSLSKRPDIEWYGTADKRSYRVSFEKARSKLGYETKTTPDTAAREIESALVSGKVSDTPETNTVNWYKHLLSDPEASKQVMLRTVVL